MKKAGLILMLLAPLLVSAQLRMLLDHGKPLLIGVPPNQALVGYINDVANFYGDSVTIGFNPNAPFTNMIYDRFSVLLCNQFSMIESNYGVGASQIADAQSDEIATNTSFIFNTNVSVWLAGYNDVFWYGTDPTALTDNFATVESMAAWLAIPTSVRVPSSYTDDYNPTNSSIYYPAGWGFLPNTLGGLAYSTQPLAASFFFSGSTLLIGTARAASGAGSVSVVVGDYDPVTSNLTPTATNVYSCVRTSPNTGPGPAGAAFGNRNYSAGLIIFTNLSTARHYAFFQPLTNTFTFLGWYAAYATNQLPKVVLAGALKVANSDYADYHPTDDNPTDYTAGSSLAADEYSLMLSNAAVVLSNAGLNVRWVPAPVLNASTDYFFDGIHPNPSGHQKLKAAIDAAF